jgi:hypothetical protein
MNRDSQATLEAPQQDRGKLIWPSVSTAPQLIAGNRARLLGSDYDVQGLSLFQLASAARRQLIDAALAYTRAYRDVELIDRRDELPSLVLAGHQPELFHPGVWLKNFMLDEVAHSAQAVAVNLVVDSDTIKASSLRVPTGAPTSPLVESVLFDRPSTAVPFEERRILDRTLFGSFAERARQKIAGLVPDPFVSQLWNDVLERSGHTDRLGECLAQGRHRWEGMWGTNTLELPQSGVCSLRAFDHFAAHLLGHLPRLWDIYNAALFDYRRANHIRSHAHPVPELAVEDDWLEAPFWIWRTEDPIRRRLFVRAADNGIVLADRAGWTTTLSLSPEQPLDDAVEQLQALAAGGVRLRTRALITTLLARVLLGDLFIHGIGGAKYDLMTDVLVERLFGIRPPDYMVVSGTLRLPIEHRRGVKQELRRTHQSLRELTYHPERFIDLEHNGKPCDRCGGHAADRSLDVVERAVESKRGWIATAKTPANARARHQAIAQANETLQPWVSNRRVQLQETLEQLESQARVEAILTSREYSFCLHPRERLREFLTGD